jgi:Tol biopolymer transport system component
VVSAPALTAACLAALPVWLSHGPKGTAAECEAPRELVARQNLRSTTTGLATVDVSGDGRYVAFVSLARLSPADDNVIDDIYVLDRSTGRVSLESVADDGRAWNGSSVHPRLSADGRFVVYATISQRLLGTRDEHGPQILRRDRTAGTTTLVSRTAAGLPGNGWSGHPDISGDGRYVVFESSATDLAAGPDANGTGTDIYVFDAVDRSIRRVSLTTAGVQPPAGESHSPAIDASGQHVVFTSTAPLDGVGVPERGRALHQVFLRDLAAGETRRLSAARQGRLPNGASYYPAISADGRVVAFISTATDLDERRRAGRHPGLHLYEVATARLRLALQSATGGPVDGWAKHPALSADGRFVVFGTDASNLLCAADCREDQADLNLVSDIYRLDTVTGSTERVSGGARAHGPWWTTSTGAAIDGSGRVVAFSSRQPTDEDDLDHDDDAFVEVLSGPVKAGDCP